MPRCDSVSEADVVILEDDRIHAVAERERASVGQIPGICNNQSLLLRHTVIAVDRQDLRIGQATALSVICRAPDFDVVITFQDVQIGIQIERVIDFPVRNESCVRRSPGHHFAAFRQTDDNVVYIDTFKCVAHPAERAGKSRSPGVKPSEFVARQVGREPHRTRIRDIVPDNAHHVGVALDIESVYDQRCRDAIGVDSVARYRQMQSITLRRCRSAKNRRHTHLDKIVARSKCDIKKRCSAVIAADVQTSAIDVLEQHSPGRVHDPDHGIE